MKKLKLKKLLIILTGTITVGCVFTFVYCKSISNKPNILLITVDALRPDHLGCYGYNKNTSPAIDELAKEGVLFTQAISQACWTWPSIYSLITSTYPSTHGVYFWDQKLSDLFPILPQMLKEKGYSTGFISAHGELGRFNRGFDFFVDISGSKAEEITKKAISWIEKNKKRHFFLWVHYMETHSDHYCNIPLEKRFAKDLTKKDVEQVCLRYDMAITHVDSQLKILSERLRNLGIYKNTLVILTADHGEEMCEHSICFNHGGFLWDSVIKVPLVIFYPRLLSRNKTIFQQRQKNTSFTI